MNSEATVYSQSRYIIFRNNITTLEAERLLRELVMSIGRELAYNEVILGHIKVLAKLLQPVAEHFLFLSLTRLDQIDVVPSECWPKEGDVIIDRLKVYVNVLVFGHTMSKVEEVVNNALKSSGGCAYRALISDFHSGIGRGINL
ncbi:hypothetical protein [Sporomusa malonica]|uniref:Uncharacterized protein n=1 Tax=Sporomusa malonica TaxID=112901 RepID=A0A1W1Y890_9FIRM|nr:hypothetical protein [Sporomusa malonica]SMC32041.1 hypothetical protein SAMN04488500_10168 [Sporomusa malonica]